MPLIAVGGAPSPRRQIRVVAIAALALLCLAPLPVRAYRPFDSTDADVADAGELELELGPVGRVREGSSRFLIAPAVIANVGLTNDRELVLEGRAKWPLGADAAASSTVIGDTALSLKQIHRRGVLQDQQGPSIASECGVLLAEINGAPGTGAGCIGILSARAAWASAHLNVGAFLDREHNWKRVFGLIAEGPFAWRLRPVAEVVIERVSNGTWSNGVLVGLIWPLRERFVLDVAARAAHTNTATIYEWRAGFTWAFQIWRR
ncbi:MAG: hypothetical protein ABI794_10200 [Betaproteobacteria bacterium]